MQLAVDRSNVIIDIGISLTRKIFRDESEVRNVCFDRGASFRQFASAIHNKHVVVCDGLDLSHITSHLLDKAIARFGPSVINRLVHRLLFRGFL